MPAVHQYLVKQERQVTVRAESPADAVRIGQAAFRDEDHDFRDIGGVTLSEVFETSIEAVQE
jgi:hypothetical protein